MFDKKLLKNFDWGLLIVVLLICVYSVIVVTSASHTLQTGSYKKVIIQTIAILVGLISILLICLFDYNILAKFSTFIYILNLFGLVLVLAIGKISNGAQSWISLGPVDIQPSEFSKLALVLTLANMFSKAEEIKTFKELLWPMVYVGIPFVAVMLQPDLGTGLVFIAIFLAIVYISGIRTKVLAQLFALGIALLPIGYKLLKPYQRNRLLSFLNPELDPMGTGYHVIQSKIAIGSGMFWGKGLFHGSQTQLYYLPEAWTDFIFSVVGEELGFVGASILIVLYAIMLYKAWKIAYNAKDKYGMLVAVGIIAMFTFHIFENIGMTIGIMPITGIPLPFMSYGGSAMVADMMAIGLLENISMRRQKINF